MLVKVCCIQDQAEAELAASMGASHIGLVSAMPSGPGPISDDAIARLIGDAPSEVVPVLLTAHTNAGDVAAQAVHTGARMIQLVSKVTPVELLAIAEACPRGLTLMPVVHVEGVAAIEVAARLSAGRGDPILLDSGRPGADTPELGGTGRTHDWSVSAQVVRSVDGPVFLAGGLTPENVGEAIRLVRPAGVDLCSGVRDGAGRLDARRLAAFMERVEAA